MYKIFVAAGAMLPKNKKHIQEAREIGRLLAENNFQYWQGARDVGLMGETYNEFSKTSDETHIITPKYFTLDSKTMKCKERITVNSINDRLEKIASNCDAAIVLPGGNGTLDEITNFVETKRVSEHSMPIILVNVDGFYNDYLKQVDLMISEGYLSKEFYTNLVYVVSTANEAFEVLKKLI